ncbi:putative TMEM14 family protein [Rosa chinensis]|uniref:Putative TMEM14 family protein n=1 Tax=Rosa chinensis TaxID=74649 RepID=A0A2P6PBS8_ROSCH|nr:putative TMEM14 family protein [Rosa chinensis]
MHDFCFTILYRLLLVGGGIFGYFRKWNTTSLFEGPVIGLVLTVASNLILQAFHKTCSDS